VLAHNHLLMTLIRVSVTRGVTAVPLKINLAAILKSMHKSERGLGGYLDGRNSG
jgi:hypothetical protein